MPPAVQPPAIQPPVGPTTASNIDDGDAGQGQSEEYQSRDGAGMRDRDDGIQPVPAEQHPVHADRRHQEHGRRRSEHATVTR